MAHEIKVTMDDGGRISAIVDATAENYYSLGMENIGKELAKLRHNYESEQRNLLRADVKKEIEDNG